MNQKQVDQLETAAEEPEEFEPGEKVSKLFISTAEEGLHEVEDEDEEDTFPEAMPFSPQQPQVSVEQLLASIGAKTVELDILRSQLAQASQIINQYQTEAKSLRKEIKRLSKGQRRY